MKRYKAQKRVADEEAPALASSGRQGRPPLDKPSPEDVQVVAQGRLVDAAILAISD